MPSTEAEWKKIASDFEQKWNFPHCIGAVDGKHVVMNAPPNSGSIYYNYKHTHSIVLMGICDANYKFIYVDVGSNGRISDGGVFNKCSFAEALDCNALNIPQPEPLPGRELEVPYVIVADDAFALKPNIMKPFPGHNLSPSERVFSYRLSRARRCIKNAFGILSAKFRVMRSPISLGPEKTRKITLASCALHNFLLSRRPDEYADCINVEGTIDDSWRKEMIEHTMYPLEHSTASCEVPEQEEEEVLERTSYPLERSSTRFIINNAKKVREELSSYFMSSAGEVPWQSKYT